ncbi:MULTISPECIES: PLDc N-terminal domain-containing protein [unclassified Amycolatopsis]|uniref:PLDc N-terminal domain-containing protein n=1 Tax=unclassified Amycolatopsis TaxID=2618356 RepID=UPI00106EE79C|nr:MULTISPECIES: PLDc N-terminal domain-containing protein [unclassified Amycolatopsis]
MRAHRKFSDLSPAQRRTVLAAAAVQVLLAAAAWRDLAKRPEDGVNGPKSAWAVAIAVNFAGPLAYFRWGRAVPRRNRRR